MATYDIVMNIAKGRVAELAKLGTAGSSLIAVPLQTTGIGTAATLRDDATLAAVLTHATEQTTMGRKTLANVVVTTDNAADKTAVDCDDITWAAASGNPVSAIALCYKPASGSADSVIVPLVLLDMVATPAGGDITYQVNASGFYNAA